MTRMSLAAATSVAVMALCGGNAAMAESSSPAARASAYAAECGACHLAYPTRLLSTREWGIVLGQLDQHYGVDASIDDPTLAHVARQLQAPVTPTLGDTGRLPRITSKAWFVDEHDAVAAGVFRSAAVKTAANCSACHAGAERGDFDEDAILVPGGKRHD